MASLSFIPASKLVDLLKAADTRKDMHVRVLSTNKLALGVDPLQPSHVVDLSKEKISTCDSAAGSKIVVEMAPSMSVDLCQPRPSSSKMMRRSGDHWFELKGRRTECRSLKELLAEGLRAIEKSRPGALEKLSHIKPRSRRIVARDPKQLFDRGHLIKDYAEKLIDGWWYGTNNSAAETNTWLERACSCAELKWGGEFRTSLMVANEALLEELLGELGTDKRN